MSVKTKYRGDVATDYDSRRQGAKWAQEEEAFRRLTREVSGTRVIDCPVGTGRWLAHLKDQGFTSIKGIDISSDMLEQTRVQVEKFDYPVALEQDDVLQRERLDIDGDAPDLVVSTRFFNWLSPGELTTALRVFSNTGPTWMLFSLRYSLESGQRPLRYRIKRLRKRIKARWANKSFLYHHDRDRTVALLHVLGYAMDQEIAVKFDGHSIFSYFLFRRAGVDHGRSSS